MPDLGLRLLKHDHDTGIRVLVINGGVEGRSDLVASYLHLINQSLEIPLKVRGRKAESGKFDIHRCFSVGLGWHSCGNRRCLIN